jgi:hypothetical protein
MKIFVLPFILIFCILSTVRCQEKAWITENKDFLNGIQEYYKYLDSLKVNKDYHYVIVDASKKHDTTELVIYYYGGSYPFFINKGKFIDFINYEGYDLFFLGDFPNPVINIACNKQLNILNDIIKNKFPNEYKYYIKGNYVAEPLICDYMELILSFKSNKLVRKNRVF